MTFRDSDYLKNAQIPPNHNIPISNRDHSSSKRESWPIIRKYKEIDCSVDEIQDNVYSNL
jgi:hypothetical protein